MKKVAVLGEIHGDGINLLKKNNIDIIHYSSQSLKKFKNNLKLIDGLVLRTAELDKKILKYFQNLKIVSRHGVGYDNVDLNFLNKNNIALAITAKANGVTVSEHVITMFLYLCKKINMSDKLVKKGKFKNAIKLPEFYEMYQKNILIVGFGRIGKELAKRCKSFDCDVYVFDPLVNANYIKKHNCKKVNLNNGLKLADFISLHVPLNHKTKNIINKSKFNLMKKNCIVVNTSRGGVINEKDLFWALKNKKIFAAGLDVFEKEPPNKKNPLFKLDNIVLSPHNAALTLECKKRMALEACQNIIDYLNNNRKNILNNIVNKKKLNL